MKTLLIVDENNLLFRMLDIGKGLLFGGKHTGGVYGFLQVFCKYVNLHKPEGVIVCADKPPYKRKDIFKEYKSNRNHETYVVGTYNRIDYIKESRVLVRKMLELMDVPVWEEVGYESDDLMAVLVEQYKNTYDNIVICSNDDDLYQLLGKGVSLQKNKELYTVDSFYRDFPELTSFSPSCWYLVLGLCGSHNGVKPLYKGLGIKTALKIFTNVAKMEKVMSEYPLEYSTNTILTHLPIDDSWDWTKFPSAESTNFSLRKLENFLMQDCGIRITKAMDEAFSILGGK